MYKPCSCSWSSAETGQSLECLVECGHWSCHFPKPRCRDAGTHHNNITAQVNVAEDQQNMLHANRIKFSFHEGNGNITLFMVTALFFARTMFMASVGLVKGTELGCWRYLCSLKISAAFLAFSTSSEPTGTQPRPWSHFRSAL